MGDYGCIVLLYSLLELSLRAALDILVRTGDSVVKVAQMIENDDLFPPLVEHLGDDLVLFEGST